VTEQRKSQRFDLRLPFEIVGNGSKSATRGETKNVSSCGVLFTSKKPVEVGDAIEYYITLPSAAAGAQVQLHCMGKVVREAAPSAFAATLERYEFVRKAG
jgi:hypothetical protein